MKLDEIAEKLGMPFLSESCAIAKSRCEAFTAARSVSLCNINSIEKLLTARKAFASY